MNRKERQNHGQRQRCREVVGEMIGIDERAAGAWRMRKERSAPIGRDKEPEQLAVPPGAFAQSDHRDRERDRQPTEEQTGVKAHFGLALANQAEGIEQDDQEDREQRQPLDQAARRDRRR